MAIPGYGVTEQIFVGGFMNFLSIYNIVITARVLLSWFPQAQGIAVLQPVYQITDPYLNLFRGIIPPVFGLDLSPLLAFFLLNVLTNVTAAVGAHTAVGALTAVEEVIHPVDLEEVMEAGEVVLSKTKTLPNNVMVLMATVHLTDRTADAAIRVIAVTRAVVIEVIPAEVMVRTVAVEVATDMEMDTHISVN